jgi:hypothetical protein
MEKSGFLHTHQLTDPMINEVPTLEGYDVGSDNRVTCQNRIWGNLGYKVHTCIYMDTYSTI